MSRPVNVFRRPLLTLLATLAVALATVGLQAGTASGGPGPKGPPAPALIVVDSITSTVAPPAGTPGEAVPYVLVEAGQSFDITVSFYDASGAPASFNKDTVLVISTDTGPANQPSPSTGKALKGKTTATLTTMLPSPANQVSVTVSAPSTTGPVAVAPGTSRPDQRFDVLAELELRDLGSPLGIGGDAGCTAATEADPVCGVVLLPNGADSNQVLLSRGLCGDEYSGCRDARGSVVQVLADLGDRYSPANPATMIVRCDKTLCLPGPIQDTKLSFSLAGNAALVEAPACPAKNTIGWPEQEACVDYVQSSRDGVGDTVLYFLFWKDARVSIR